MFGKKFKITLLSVILVSIVNPAQGWWLTDWLWNSSTAPKKVKIETAGTQLLAVASAAFLLPTCIFGYALYSYITKNRELCGKVAEHLNEINAVKAAKVKLEKENNEMNKKLSGLDQTKAKLDKLKELNREKSLAKIEKFFRKQKIESAFNIWSRDIRKKRAQKEHDEAHAKKSAGHQPLTITIDSHATSAALPITNSAITEERSLNTSKAQPITSAASSTATAAHAQPSESNQSRLTIKANRDSFHATALDAYNQRAEEEKKKKRDAQITSLTNQNRQQLYPPNGVPSLPSPTEHHQRRPSFNAGQQHNRTMDTLDRQVFVANNLLGQQSQPTTNLTKDQIAQITGQI